MTGNFCVLKEITFKFTRPDYYVHVYPARLLRLRLPGPKPMKPVIHEGVLPCRFGV